MFMREVGRCDESYHGVGYLIIVLNHHIEKGKAVIELVREGLISNMHNKFEQDT